MVLTDLLGMEVHRQVEDGTGTEHMGKTQWLRRALLDQGFWSEGRKLWAAGGGENHNYGTGDSQHHVKK